MSALDDAIKRWDVVRFLRRRGLEVRLTETGEAHVKCPRCHENKYRLYCNRRTKNWICFNCMRKGRGALSFIEFVMDCDQPEAVRALVESNTGGGRILPEEDVEEAPRHTEMEVDFPQRGFKPLTLPADERSEPYWEYLIERKITPSMVRQYNIGYCRKGLYFPPVGKPFKVNQRVVVPITIFGKQRGWVARSIDPDEKRKYLNPPGVHTGRLLFNIDNVMDNGSDRIVLVEGVFDALRMPDIMACTFGKKISIQQVEILGEAGFRKLVFCYDGDALRDAAHYIREAIPSAMQCYRAVLPPQYDPGNAPATVLHRAIENAELWNLGTHR